MYDTKFFSSMPSKHLANGEMRSAITKSDEVTRVEKYDFGLPRENHFWYVMPGCVPIAM